MSRKVEYRNGFKYMYCEQCDLDFNVPIKEKECEANGETCRSERPCESGNAVHNG